MGKNKQYKADTIIRKADNKSVDENLFISLFAIVVIICFLFPAFLGKIDAPIDIRDHMRYPWKYHSIDSKVIKKDISDLIISSDNGAIIDYQDQKSLYKFSLSPKQDQKLQIKLNYQALSNYKVRKDFNYYIKFDFLFPIQQNNQIDILVYLQDRNGNIINLPFAVFPRQSDYKSIIDSKWLQGKINLNFILDSIGSFDKLEQYKTFLVFKNRSDSVFDISLQNFKISTEDFSNVTPLGIHNFYLEDLIILFSPIRESFSRSIKEGKIPFWNNYILTGTEFIADPQVGYFNPIYYFSYLFFDHFTAHLIILFLFLFLCFLGAYKLARFWGCTIYASLLVSLVYAFNPYIVPWLGFEHTVMILSLLPFLILYYEKALSSINFLSKELIISSFLFGLIILSGHLQVSYYAIITFLLYVVYKIVLDKDNIKKYLYYLIFIFVFGFAIGCIVSIPFLHSILSTHRLPLSEENLKFNCFRLSALKGILNPYYSGSITWNDTDRYSLDHDYMDYKNNFFKNYVYFGFLPFLILLFSLKSFFKNKLVMFLYLLIFISFLFAANGDFYLLIRNFIPGFNVLQNVRFIQLYACCIPFLVGVGLDNFFKIMDLSDKKMNICFLFVLLIATVDLLHYSSFFITWSDRPSYKQVHSNGALEFLIKKKNDHKEPFRVLAVESPYSVGFALKPTSVKPDDFWVYDIEDVNGYTSFFPRDIYWILVYVKLQDVKKLYTKHQPYFYRGSSLLYPTVEYKNKIFDLLNVKYFITSPDTILDKNYAENIFNGDCRIWLNKNYLPRAFLANTYKIISDKAKAIAYLDSDEFNPEREVIFQELSTVLKNQVDKIDKMDLNFNVDFNKYENEKISLNVRTNKASFLILGNNLNDNWKVKVNEKEEKLLKANVVQSAVFLPKAGQYKVEFYYYPKYFYIGLAFTALSLLILCLLYLYLTIKGNYAKNK